MGTFNGRGEPTPPPARTAARAERIVRQGRDGPLAIAACAPPHVGARGGELGPSELRTLRVVLRVRPGLLRRPRLVLVTGGAATVRAAFAADGLGPTHRAGHAIS